jgi:hypothetical protein
VVRELGLERRETVRSLSATNEEKILFFVVVREDSVKLNSHKSIMCNVS